MKLMEGEREAKKSKEGRNDKGRKLTGETA